MANQSSEDQFAELAYAIDSLWILVCGFLVFFMQAGFAMLEVGAVRMKNAQNILMKNLFDIAVGSVLWWLLGYAFAYGEDQGGFIGTGQLFANTSEPGVARDWFFQWAFAATAATIVSGALAERTRLLAYALFSMFITAFIYPVVVHWTWGGGWLTNCGPANCTGYSDFAGSGIVHMVGGFCGLVGAVMVGPRAGRFMSDAENKGCCCFRLHSEYAHAFRPHNVPSVILGTLILWFGWYGFNCGSTLAFTGENVNVAGVVAVNTSIAAGAGGLTVLAVRYGIEKNAKQRTFYDVSATANGILAGLVSITAGCAGATDYGACIIGVIGGLVYVGSSYIVRKMGIDDPLDAFAIHGACGVWGVFAVGLFDTATGAFYGAGGNQLAWQIAGICSISVWSLGLSALFFGLLRACGQLRVSDGDEVQGLDTLHHGGGAYNIENRLELQQLTANEATKQGESDLGNEEPVQLVVQLKEENMAAAESAQ